MYVRRTLRALSRCYPTRKRKELRSGKDCNKLRKGYVMYADFEFTLEPERCPVPLHLGSMVAFKPAAAFTKRLQGSCGI